MCIATNISMLASANVSVRVEVFFNPAYPFPFFPTHWTFLHALLRVLGPPLWNHCCRVYCFNKAFTNETLTRGYWHKPGEISHHFLSNFYLLAIFPNNYGYNIITLCVCEWQRQRCLHITQTNISRMNSKYSFKGNQCCPACCHAFIDSAIICMSSGTPPTQLACAAVVHKI